MISSWKACPMTSQLKLYMTKLRATGYVTNMKGVRALANKRFIFTSSLIDDTKYVLDRDIMNKSIRHLESNLKWLYSLKRNYDEVHSDVYVRLESLALIEKLPRGASNDELILYVKNKLDVLRLLTPMIKDTTLDFRSKYILSNPFIQYVYRLLSNNMDVLPTELLSVGLHIILDIGVVEVIDVCYALYYKICNSSTCLITKLSLSRKLLRMVYNNKLKNNGQLTNVVNGLIREIISCIEENVDCVEDVLSILCTMDRDEDLINNYMGNLQDYVYLLKPKILLNVLQAVYRLNYTDDKFYNLITESLLYKYDFMTFDEKMTLLLLLPFLKHLWLLNSPNISTSIYSECSMLLNTLLRRDMESKIEHMNLPDMLNPIIALSLLFKQSKVIRKLLLKRIDADSIKAMDHNTFYKAIICCSNLHITSSYIDVSRIIANNISKLLQLSLYDKFHSFYCLQNILAKRHFKYVAPLVYNIIEESQSDHSILINTIELICKTKLHKIDQNLIPYTFKPLFPTLNFVEAEGSTELNDKHTANITQSLKISNEIVYIKEAPNNLLLLENKVSSDKSSLLLVKLLEGAVKLKVETSQIKLILNNLYMLLLSKMRGNSKFPSIEIARIIDCMAESRIINEDLLNYSLERVYNDPEMLEDVESATIILKGIEFINNKEWIEKLSYPLFQFCTKGPSQHLNDVLLLQKYARHEFYKEYCQRLKESNPMTLMDTHPFTSTLLKPTTGKLHYNVAKYLSTLDMKFEHYYNLDDIIVDFYSSKLNLALQIVRSDDYYKEDYDIHLKSRPALIARILKCMGVKLILIPEHIIKKNTNLIEI